MRGGAAGRRAGGVAGAAYSQRKDRMSKPIRRPPKYDRHRPRQFFTPYTRIESWAVLDRRGVRVTPHYPTREEAERRAAELDRAAGGKG
jgi:hypothetical protein